MWGMSLVVRRVVLTGVWGFVVCVDRFFRVVLGVWDAFVWRLGGSVSPDLLGAFGNSANMAWAAWGALQLAAADVAARVMLDRSVAEPRSRLLEITMGLAAAAAGRAAAVLFRE